MHMSAYPSVGMCKSVKVPMEVSGVRFPEVSGDLEPPSMGAGNLTKIL